LRWPTFEAIDYFLYRLQITSALFDDVAVRIDDVVLGRRFGDQIFDEAVQLGSFRTVFAFD
jgi:hypothetical protein